MFAKHKCVGVVCALFVGAFHAFAQWPGGSSPVVSRGESVTLSAPQPSIVRFTDNGTLTFAAGGSVTITGAVTTAVGSGTNESGVLNLSGGSITKTGSGYLVVGYLGGTGSLVISSGSTLTATSGRIRIAGNEDGQRELPSFGEATVSGFLNADILEFTGFYPTNLTPPYVEYARLALNTGGVVEAAQLQKNDCANTTFLFNGGTLRAKQAASDFIVGRGVMDMVIADNTNAVFDTNGKNVTINPQASPYDTVLTLRGKTGGAASGNGGFVKAGEGALVLRLPASCNTFTGAVTVLQGTLDLGRPLADNQPVTVAAGANFVLRSTNDLDNVTFVDGGTGMRMLYTVAFDTRALDLTALTSQFYDERLGGPFTGTVTLSNTVTHSAGAVGNPFRLIGQGGALNLTNTALEAGALQVEGPGTFNFLGSRVYTSVDTGKLVLADGGYRQDQTFAVADASASTPSSLGFATGRFLAGYSLDVGVSGYGAFAANGTALTAGRLRVGGGTGFTGGFTQSTGTVTLSNSSFIGFDGGTGSLTVAGGQFIVNNNLYVASNPSNNTALRPQGSIAVSNALLRCADLRMSTWWPSDGSAKALEAGQLTLLSGGVAEVNSIYKNDDPISTVTFRGGTLRARAASGNFLQAEQVFGTLRVVAEAGEYAAIDTGANAVTVVKPTGTLVVTGPGGLKKLGSGMLTFSASQVTYAGDTLVQAGTLRLGDHNQIPHGTGTGNVWIASNATLDLNGKNESVNRLIGQGLVRSTNAPATLGVLANGADDTWERAWLNGFITLDKLGAGTLTLAAAQAAPTNLVITAGTVKLGSASGFPFYRFKVEGIKNPATANAMQLSEIKLFNDGVDVTANRVGIDYDSTGGRGTDAEVSAFPDNEMPENAVDGIVNIGTTTGNKWLDFRAKASRTAADKDRVWLRINFPGAQKITHYNWATGNDSEDRDPAAWRLQGSYDGVTWTDLDVKTGYSAISTRNAWVSAGGFPVSSVNAANILCDSAQVTVGRGASLDLNGLSETIGGLTGYGAVALSHANLTVNTPAGVTNRFYGSIGGEGSVVKAGTGHQLFGGTNTLTGDVVVQAGTLGVVGVGAPNKWFRFTIKKNRADIAVTQLSELALYSEDGTRRNLGLTKGGATNTLLQGQFATPIDYTTGSGSEGPDKLFDNSSATKWCLTLNTPTPTNAASYRVIVMRLTNTAPEIVAYNLCTANDVSDRNPTWWTLEASADGVNWLEVDARSGVVSPTEFLTWYNAGTPYTLANRAVSTGDAEAIPDSSVVEIRAGASLSLSGKDVIGALRVDLAAGAGTINQLTAKEKGELYLVNVTGRPSGWVIPLTVASVANPGTLKTWTVYADGKALAGYTLKWDAATGLFRLVADGTIVRIF